MQLTPCDEWGDYMLISVLVIPLLFVGVFFVLLVIIVKYNLFFLLSAFVRQSGDGFHYQPYGLLFFILLMLAGTAFYLTTILGFLVNRLLECLFVSESAPPAYLFSGVKEAADGGGSGRKNAGIRDADSPAGPPGPDGNPLLPHDDWPKTVLVKHGSLTIYETDCKTGYAMKEGDV